MVISSNDDVGNLKLVIKNKAVVDDDNDEVVYSALSTDDYLQTMT